MRSKNRKHCLLKRVLNLKYYLQFDDLSGTPGLMMTSLFVSVAPFSDEAPSEKRRVSLPIVFIGEELGVNDTKIKCITNRLFEANAENHNQRPRERFEGSTRVLNIRLDPNSFYSRPPVQVTQLRVPTKKPLLTPCSLRRRFRDLLTGLVRRPFFLRFFINVFNRAV